MYAKCKLFLNCLRKSCGRVSPCLTYKMNILNLGFTWSTRAISGFHFFIFSLKLTNDVILFRLSGISSQAFESKWNIDSEMESRKCFHYLNYIFCYFKAWKFLCIIYGPLANSSYISAIRNCKFWVSIET